MSLFSVIYYILASFVYLLALPYLIYKSRTLKYKHAIPAKFFLRNNPSFYDERVWFHCCSFGEVRALKPIVDSLDEEVNISVITNTGFEEAQKFNAQVRYLPFEIFLPFWVNKQKALFVLEAELWYMLFLWAQIKKTKTFLINARISDKSYASYKRFSFFYKRVFKHINKVYAQSQLDKERLMELGARDVEVIGNIKLAQLPKISKALVKPEGFMITAGSTHEKEEELILEAFDASLGRLIVVPRHPERFEQVDGLLKAYANKHNLSYHRYSKEAHFNSDIVLVDAMGELINIYAISDCVILGGAFEKIGGHNPVEPAFFNCRIISGEAIFNQKPLFESIQHYTLVENDKLKEVLQNVHQLPQAKLVDIGSVEPIIKEINAIR